MYLHVNIYVYIDNIDKI